MPSEKKSVERSKHSSPVKDAANASKGLVAKEIEAQISGDGGVGPRYGRRAKTDRRDEEKGTSESGGAKSRRHRPKDQEVGPLPTLGADAEEQGEGKEQQKLRLNREKLIKSTAEAPSGYQEALPRLSELDISSNWDRLLQSINTEFDMSSITACLANELDEDVTWNPEMLLVQLTSEMLDAAEQAKEGAASHAMAEQGGPVGLMKGGEVVRKRKERAVVNAEEGGDAPTEGSESDRAGKSSRGGSQSSGVRAAKNGSEKGSEGTKSDLKRANSRKKGSNKSLRK